MGGFTADQPGPTILAMAEGSHARFADPRIPLAEYLSERAAVYGIPIARSAESEFLSSDDGPFFGFVPAARFAFGSQEIGERFHSPYDTVESVQDQGEVMEQSAWMALIAALETPLDAPALRLTPEPERPALIIATHTEVIHMTATMLIHLDRALAWDGFHVDVIPYGQAVTAENLAEADLVLALPVTDYASVDGDPTLYDEAWLAEEIALLVDYVEQGGFLVLTDSAKSLFRGRVVDVNEDWEDVNALAAPFGIRFAGEPLRTIRARVAGAHPITGDLFDLVMMPDNGLPLLTGGEALAEAQGEVAIGLVDYGGAGGQVLALSDLGRSTCTTPGRANETIWSSCAISRAMHAADEGDNDAHTDAEPSYSSRLPARTDDRRRRRCPVALAGCLQRSGGRRGHRDCARCARRAGGHGYRRLLRGVLSPLGHPRPRDLDVPQPGRHVWGRRREPDRHLRCLPARDAIPRGQRARFAARL
jgi:hypothetical protein